MPSLLEIGQKKQKIFIKKSYRSWDLLGQNTNKSDTAADKCKEHKSSNQQKDNNWTTKRQQLDNN